MSSARAEFFTPAGEFIGYGVYSGTSNVLSPGITPEVDWSVGGWERLKDCQHEGEPAIVYSDYGGGDHWPGTVCRECRVWKGKLSQYEPDYGYSIPPAEERAEWKAWHEDWPKDGHPFPTWTPTEPPGDPK